MPCPLKKSKDEKENDSYYWWIRKEFAKIHANKGGNLVLVEKI